MLPALTFYFFSAVTLASAVMVISARNPVHAVFFLILSFFSTAGLFILLGAEFLAMLLIVVYVGAVAVLFLFVVMMLDVPIPTVKAWFVPQMKGLLSATGKVLSYLVIFLATMYLFIASVVFALYYGLKLVLINPAGFVLNPVAELTFFFHTLTNNTLAGSASVVFIFALSIWLARRVAMKTLDSTFLEIVIELMRQSSVGLIIAGVLIGELVMVFLAWGETEIAAEMTLLPTPPSAILPNTHALGQYLYTDYLYIFQTAGLILLVAMIAAIVLTQRRRPWVLRQDINEQVSRRRIDSVELKKVKVGAGVEKWT